MDIQVLITTSTTDSTGPFNIVGNPGNVTIATGQTKSQLVAGKTFTGISELINEITITDTGVCNQAITRSVIGAGGVTPTPTPYSLNVYTGCGRGNSVGTTCTDSSNNRTFYSNCPSISFGTSCVVYVDGDGNNVLSGYDFVYINGQTWNINSSTGVVGTLTAEQC